MSKLKFVFLFFISLLICCASETGNEAREKEADRSNDSTNKILKELRVAEKAQQLDTLFKNKAKIAGFNGCVLVAQRGQVIYKNSFGFANLKTKDSLKINSAFQLASSTLR